MNQSEFKVNSCNRRQARENACERGMVGFGLASHWLKKWRAFCEPITERSKAKPKQTCNYFRHSGVVYIYIFFWFTWREEDPRRRNNSSFALHAEISTEVVNKWRRKRRITVGLYQLTVRLPPCLLFLSLILGASERK